jgi:hypothetical protein
MSVASGVGGRQAARYVGILLILVVCFVFNTARAACPTGQLGRVDGFDKGFDQYYTACEADERAEGDVGFLAT